MKKLLLGFCLAPLTVLSQNVLIGNKDLPNEPSICINTSYPSRLVAGANLNKYYYSSDTGRTWQERTLVSSFGVWGDPVVVVDSVGNFYFFHLSNTSGGNWIDRIVCQKSVNFGQTWTDGTYTGLNGTKAQDKQWAAINPVNNHIFLTWTQFDEYGSTNTSDSSLILFSRSEDGGMTWTQAKRISTYGGNCFDQDSTVEGAVPAVGPQGQVYVAWAGPRGIVFNKSYDEGNTWLKEEKIISTQPGGWEFAISGVFRCNGMPVTKCDLSGGEHHGRIYINWSDQRNGTDDTDIWLIYSDDEGESWSAPKRVNTDPPGKQQFFTWMDVDQANGDLFFIYYDRRNFEGDTTEISLAWSRDGSEHIYSRIISDTPFVPVKQVFLGDYTNIHVWNHIVRPIWTRQHQGELSIWTDITPFDSLVSGVQEPPLAGTTLIYPNPTRDEAYVSFKLHERSEVRIVLYTVEGKAAGTILEKQFLDYGKHVIPYSTAALRLSPGIYYPRMWINGMEKRLPPLSVGP